jgi:hypothetical protein
MLSAMGTGAWVAVGVLLAAAGLLVAALVGVLVARRRAEPPGPAPVDDLQTFLESPPGSSAGARTHSGALVTLTAPAPAPASSRLLSRVVVGAVAGVAVLLLVAAAVVGWTASTTDDSRRAGDAEARMRFDGLVLQQQAVGVTVTYPEIELSSDGDESVAKLTLPTWNCLAAEAPDDPEAAGCVPGRTEFAELRSPDLVVQRTDHGIRFGGEFETTTRPTGGAPEGTGRSYAIAVSVTADGDGTLELEDRRVRAVESEVRIDG